MLDKSTAGHIFRFNAESDHNMPACYENILLYQIGEVRYEQGVDDVHQQWCYELSVILSGSGYFSLNDKKIAVHKNEIILTPKQGVHTVTASNNKFRFLYLGFDLAPGAASESIQAMHQRLQSLRENQSAFDCYDVGGLLNHMLSEFNQELPYSSEYIANCLKNVLILTCRTFAAERVVERPTDSGLNPQIVGTTVYALIKQIEENIYSLPDIRTLARQMHFSYSYISHVFKEKTGTTLQHYILQAKIDKSRELILDGRWTLSEIATMLNYESLQAFSKAFKKEVGICPREYKKQQEQLRRTLPHSNNGL